MKNVFTRFYSFLVVSLFLTIFSVTSVKAYSEIMVADTIPVVKNESSNEVYTRAEKMPQFPGGEEAMLSFLSENIVIPAEARENFIYGTVVVQFLVEKTGKIMEPEVVRGIPGGCDEEALRVVKLMPDWIPGYQNGEAVRIRYTLPIRFRPK